MRVTSLRSCSNPTQIGLRKRRTAAPMITQGVAMAVITAAIRWARGRFTTPSYRPDGSHLCPGRSPALPGSRLEGGGLAPDYLPHEIQIRILDPKVRDVETDCEPAVQPRVRQKGCLLYTSPSPRD